MVNKIVKPKKLKLTQKQDNRELKLFERKLDKCWSGTVKERDGYKCVICGSTKMLNAHHIIPRQIKSFRWNVDNGIAICPKHHEFSFECSAKKGAFIFYEKLRAIRPEQMEKLLQSYYFEKMESVKDKTESKKV